MTLGVDIDMTSLMTMTSPGMNLIQSENNKVHNLFEAVPVARFQCVVKIRSSTVSSLFLLQELSELENI